MPSQFPPYSTVRHSAIQARRNSRKGPDVRYQQQHPEQHYPDQHDVEKGYPEQHYPEQYYPEQQQQQQQQHQHQQHQRQHQHQHERPHSRHSRDEQQYQPRHQQRPYVEQQRRQRRKVSNIRGHFVAMTGEFVGTIMFLWFALAGAQTANTLAATNNNDIGRFFYISLVFGLSLLVSAWAFYRISGGLFNPAVTIGMVVAGQMPLVRGICIIPSQILGGIAASALVQCMFPGPIDSIETLLGPTTSITRGVFIEMFLTFILVFTILMLAAEDNYAKPVAPVGIGLALFTAMLVGSSLNPARSFGPAVVNKSFPGYHYIYWFGPIMGGLVAAGYYRFVKALYYEDAQPGQDKPPQ